MRNYIVESEELLESLEGINIGTAETFLSAPTTIAHIHSQVELLYITRGIFTVTVNDTNFTLNSGDLILFPKYAVHSAASLSKDGGKYYFFHIHPTIISEMTRTNTASLFQFFFSLESSAKKLVWRKNELKSKEFSVPLDTLIKEYENNDIFTFTSRKLNLCKLLLAVMRDSYAHNPAGFKHLQNNNMLPVIQKAIEYINTNYASDIKAKALSDMLGYNYKYFLRSFADITGEGFSQYLNRTRIKFAKNLLLNSASPIHDIAQAVGYNSDSYFILEFKKQIGLTPLQFVKEYRDRGVEF